MESGLGMDALPISYLCNTIIIWHTIWTFFLFPKTSVHRFRAFCYQLVLFSLLLSVLLWIFWYCPMFQALRPFILYHTFGLETLEVLDQVTRWIISHEWTVGELWNMMVEYGSKRLKGETRVGFFSWLLPLVDSNDAWAVGHHLNLHEIYWTLTKISSLLGTFLAWCGSYLIHPGRLA